MDKPPKSSLNPKDICIILTNKQDNSKTFLYGKDSSGIEKIYFSSNKNKGLSSYDGKASHLHYISPGKYGITVEYDFPDSPRFTLECQIISKMKYLKRWHYKDSLPYNPTQRKGKTGNG